MTTETHHPVLAYDIGAHRGEDVEFYLRYGYRVVAVEANPVLVDALRARFAEEIDQGRCVVVACAVSDSPGEATFFVNEHLSVWGTLEPERDERNRQLGTSSRSVTVTCRTLEDLFAEYGTPDFLKIDVEGVDLRIVRSMSPAGQAPRTISMESSEKSLGEVAEELDELHRLGYREFKVVRQGLHRLRGRRWRGMDGRTIHHTFTSASSGPPPDLVGGRWLTREQALRKYRRIYVVYRLIGGESRLQEALRRWPRLRRGVGFVCGWYDTHARLHD